MTTFESVDFFTDPSLVPDPHPYFDYLRSKNPVLKLPNYNVFAVTGYDEATAVYKDTDTFSNCVALGGPFPPLPFQPEGDDIGAQIDAHRDQFPMFEHMVTMDPPEHTRARSLLSRLLTPSRLKENEDFMWRLADRQLEEFLAEGECEFIAEYSKPFATLVIADLLGVPEEDHKQFRTVLGADRPEPGLGRSTMSRSASTRWSGLTTSSAPTSRTGAVSRATTCSPPWRRRSTRMDPPPKSSRWCAQPPSCSQPDRKPPPSCCPRRCRCLETARISSNGYARIAV
ncbi:putative cytochrome P450 [Mycobacterium xenopi 3993]|nr:putative cytochrome P450 [Mycobacterium xenopi 3993]